MLDVSKIFLYELRRMLGSKFYLGFGTVILWYGWQILNNVTILGVANTAPFSPWSFGAYLTGLLPLLGVVLLFFLWNLCNAQARGVQSLTDAASVRRERYQLTKYLAALTAWLSLVVVVTMLGISFLWTLFGDSVPVAALLLVAVITLVPPAALLLGVGAVAGGLRSWTLFVLMALVFGAGFLPGDFYGASLFTEYPLTLGVLDPAFSMPPSVVIGKLAVLLVGVGLLLQTMVSKRVRLCRNCASRGR